MWSAPAPAAISLPRQALRGRSVPVDSGDIVAATRQNGRKLGVPGREDEGEGAMQPWWVAGFAGAVGFFLTTPAIAGDVAPKRGGTLTYTIPADAPPSF